MRRSSPAAPDLDVRLGGCCRHTGPTEGKRRLSRPGAPEPLPGALSASCETNVSETSGSAAVVLGTSWCRAVRRAAYRRWGPTPGPWHQQRRGIGKFGSPRGVSHGLQEPANRPLRVSAARRNPLWAGGPCRLLLKATLTHSSRKPPGFRASRDRLLESRKPLLQHKCPRLPGFSNSLRGMRRKVTN